MTVATDLEPLHRRILDRRRTSHDPEPCRAALISEATDMLAGFFASEVPGATVSGVRRVGGGASKEQFIFTLTDGGHSEAYLLRMDPRLAITETDRQREYDLLTAMNGVVPVPETAWIDPRAEHFPQPAAIMRVVRGVTKPSNSKVKVSGLGTWLGPDFRDRLKGQFLDHLVAIHAYDWRARPVPGFDVPDADPKQAARWIFNYWRELMEIDQGVQRPIESLAQQWLAANLPDTTDMVMIHGDYRTGNYLFDEDTCEITALLDWELARIGDFHEDLAWVLMRLFGTFDESGLFRASDLFEREEFIAAYQARSSRTVDRTVLHFYEVLSSWKCYIICAANALAAARSQHNHQDVLLTFLAGAAPVFADDLVNLLGQGAGQ